MANKYGMVKCYFEHGLWSANQVKHAVSKGLITSTQYKDITGAEFDLAGLNEKPKRNKKIKSIKQYIVDGFTEDTLAGCPCAVCVLSGTLSEALMQKIATANGNTQTAFVNKKGANYNIRWFSQKCEIDMCGQNLLAVGYVLFNYYEKNKEELSFDTDDGIINVFKNDDVYEVDFPQYEIEKTEVTAEMEQALGIPVKEAFLGRDLMLVADDSEAVAKIKPDFEKLMKLDGLEVHVTAPGSKADCVIRTFGPKIGVAEETVSGTGNCYITPYWRENLGKNVIVSRQISKRGVNIYCKIVKEGRVRLCGKAALYSEATIYVDQA